VTAALFFVRVRVRCWTKECLFGPRVAGEGYAPAAVLLRGGVTLHRFISKTQFQPQHQLQRCPSPEPQMPSFGLEHVGREIVVTFALAESFMACVGAFAVGAVEHGAPLTGVNLGGEFFRAHILHPHRQRKLAISSLISFHGKLSRSQQHA